MKTPKSKTSESFPLHPCMAPDYKPSRFRQNLFLGQTNQILVRLTERYYMSVTGHLCNIFSATAEVYLGNGACKFI